MSNKRFTQHMLPPGACLYWETKQSLGWADEDGAWPIWENEEGRHVNIFYTNPWNPGVPPKDDPEALERSVGRCMVGVKADIPEMIQLSWEWFVLDFLGSGEEDPLDVLDNRWKEQPAMFDQVAKAALESFFATACLYDR